MPRLHEPPAVRPIRVTLCTICAAAGGAVVLVILQ